jgi:hypothetical protein
MRDCKGRFKRVFDQPAPRGVRIEVAIQVTEFESHASTKLNNIT